MSLEENKAIVRRYFEEVRNKGNLDAINELVTPDFVEHLSSDEIDFRGMEKLKQLSLQGLTSMPDRRYTILDIIAEGDQGSGAHESLWHPYG